MTDSNELMDLQEDGDLAETRVYELGFHLDGELPQEEVKKMYQGIRDRISAVGTLVAEGEPTKVPLAYTISRQETTGRRDFDTAFFCWIAYEATRPTPRGTMISRSSLGPSLPSSVSSTSARARRPPSTRPRCMSSSPRRLLRRPLKKKSPR
jgi:hypothetical protein